MTKQNKLPPLSAVKKNPVAVLWDRIINSDKLYLVAAFFLPLLINWIIFIIRGVYPFGENSVLVLDLNGQYVYFFEAMKDILQGDASPFYSWYRALGGEFSGIYAYYVASPFSLVTLFFSENSITEALLAMTLLKVGSMGLTFAIYLHYSRPSKPINIIIFSTMYALMSYAVVQANNTMWIDALIYLPLIALGIEQICNTGKFLLYTVTLALCFIANFYIGFMMAIFCTLYFFYYYISKHPMGDFTRFFFAFYKWLVCSVAAAGIASVIIIPTYYSLQFGKNTFSNPKFDFESKFDYINVFTQMLPNSYDTVRPEGLPFIYCGVLSLILLPVYFVTDRIKGREKVMSGIILALMVFSFTASTVDLFWHGLQRPNWLNYRYSFMFCFLVLVFAYEAFRFMQDRTFRTVAGCAGVIGLCVVFVQTMDFEFLDDIFCIWFTVIMLGILTAMLWGVSKKRLSAGVLCAVVCLELFLNGIYDSFSLHDDVYYSSRTSYVEFMERWRPIVEDVKAQDTGLYRMEKTVHRKVNDNMTLQIKGITNSTSTLNASVITLLNKMGYASKSHWSRYAGGNPISDSLLGIKYVMSNSQNLSDMYEFMFERDDTTDEEGKKKLYAYENPYALPLLYGVSTNLLDYDITSEYSAPDVLNSMISGMLGYETDIFTPVGKENITEELEDTRRATADGHTKIAKLTEGGNKGNITFTFKAEQTGDIYIHFPSKYPRDTQLSVAHYTDEDASKESFRATYTSKGSYMTNETHTIFNIGHYEEGETVSVRLTLKKDDLYYYNGQDYIFYFNQDNFEQAFSDLAESGVNVTDYSDTSIDATVNVKAGDTLMFTSIPYDEGSTVKHHGKKVELKKSLNSLLCFDITEGEHTVEMTYAPQGFYIGLIICIICIGAVSYFGYKDISSRRKRRNKLLGIIRSEGSGYRLSEQSRYEHCSSDSDEQCTVDSEQSSGEHCSSDSDEQRTVDSDH